MSEQQHTVTDTDLGRLTIAVDGDELTGLRFVRGRAAEVPAPAEARGDLLEEAVEQVQQYLAGNRRAFDLPVAHRGDEFQERVWAETARIPFGSTTTYGELAGRLGDRSLAQRVGQALAANPVCVVVPCHRVLGSGGRLTGYAGGIRRKQRLLELEGSVGPQLF